jgi:hypothetical protein
MFANGAREIQRKERERWSDGLSPTAKKGTPKKSIDLRDDERKSKTQHKRRREKSLKLKGKCRSDVDGNLVKHVVL